MSQEKRLGFARLLRDWRQMMAAQDRGEKRGEFTQQEAADYLDFHVVTYRRWENGRISIKWYNYESVMQKIAETAEGVEDADSQPVHTG